MAIGKKQLLVFAVFALIVIGVRAPTPIQNTTAFLNPQENWLFWIALAYVAYYLITEK